MTDVTVPLARWVAGLTRHAVPERVRTPGHSPDHVALLHEPTRTLLTGDAVFHRGMTPSQGRYRSWLRTRLRSTS